MICIAQRRGDACNILAYPRKRPASPHAHSELVSFRLETPVSDLDGGYRGYPSDKDMTRPEDRFSHADTRFNLNPLNPITRSEKTYPKMYEPEYGLFRLRPCAESLDFSMSADMIHHRA